MPATPNRPCRRCKRTLTTETYCQACAAIIQKKRQEADNRPPPHQRGYDKKWGKVRKMKMSIDPLCERCLEHGVLEPAAVVHHVQEIADSPELRLAIDNLMSLCRDCHERVHGRVKGGHGVDGLPVGGWKQ